MELNEITAKLSRFLNDGVLTAYPAKHKLKVYALFYLSSKFERGRRYTEPEVNALLDRFSNFNDAALLRRELYEHRFLNRKPDGSEYWQEDRQLSDFKLD